MKAGVVVVDGERCGTDWLDALGIPWRPVPFQDLVDPHLWKDIRLVCLPSAARLDTLTLANLLEFCEGGGSVYAEACRMSDPPQAHFFRKIFGLLPTNRTVLAEHERLFTAPGRHDMLRGLPARTILDAFETSYLHVQRHGCKVLLFGGKFAGTYRVVNPLPADRFPALVAHRPGKGRAVYAAFPLSGFLSRGFAPSETWRQLAKRLVSFLGCRPRASTDGWERHAPYRTAARSSASRPADSAARSRRYREAIRNNLAWFERSGVLPRRDGSAGVLEAVELHTGRLRCWQRTDCIVQSALLFMLASRLFGARHLRQRALNLFRFLESRDYQDRRPSSPARGFWSWHSPPRSGNRSIWMDDNSWAAVISFWFHGLTAGRTFLRQGLETADALLRFQHVNGLHWASCTSRDLERRGLAYYRKRPIPRGDYYSASTHFASGPISAFAWAFALTGRRELWEAAVKECRRMLAYVPHYRGVYHFSHTQADARLLLPLTIMHHIEPRGEWQAPLDAALARIADRMAPCGALQERHPHKNLAGDVDIPSVTGDGEPICDLLYSSSFALLNLWLAHKLADRPRALPLFRRLGDFLTSIQMRSRDPKFNGAWVRSFDFKAWEYYGSNADKGWGPYVMETGWTNAIIGAALAMHELDFDVRKLIPAVHGA